MTAPFFSIIMPTYNRREGARRCLEALKNQTFDPGNVEVIVAIDGSTDGTADSLRALSVPYALTILELENGGAGRARNAAAAKAEGRFLAFTEDDVDPCRTWLAQAYEILKGDQWDVVEGHTRYPGSQTSVRQFEPTPRPSFIPCNLFVRREIFASLGGYSPDFYDRKEHLYFREDSDFGFRLMAAGARVRVEASMVVIHPLQFQKMSGCFRHARRYRFDPLLYKRHPREYRDFIEAKTLGSMTIHRPQHYVALVDVVALITTIGGVVAGRPPVALAAAGAIFFCGWLFRYKYQGIRSLRLYRLDETFGFCLLPFVYLAAVLKGCVKYRVVRVLV